MLMESSIHLFLYTSFVLKEIVIVYISNILFYNKRVQLLSLNQILAYDAIESQA
jgi:hypothetical protein